MSDAKRGGGPGDDPSAASGDPAELRSRVDLVASRENLEFLRRYLKSTHRFVTPQDVDDITTNVMTRLIGRINSGEWTPIADATMIRGYLRKAADWAVVDFYRLSQRTHENPVPNEVLHDLILTDDEAVATLSRAATADGVRAALGRIQDSGDVTLFVVVTYLLDEIQRTGKRPSNRQTAVACGLSHTAVANALVRMRPYFATAREIAQER
jgi:hypothetical protein